MHWQGTYPLSLELTICGRGGIGIRARLWGQSLSARLHRTEIKFLSGNASFFWGLSSEAIQPTGFGLDK